MVQSPVEWSVADVVSYFTEAGFPEQATAFRMQVCVQLPPAATRAQHCSTPLFSLVSVPSVCLQTPPRSALAASFNLPAGFSASTSLLLGYIIRPLALFL